MNSVSNIIELIKNNQLSHDIKIELKNLGPPRPDLLIKNVENNLKTNKTVSRKFNRSSYSLSDWLCGCNVQNAFFCFVCLIKNSPQSDPAWTSKGISDLKHLGEKVNRHKRSEKHLNNMIEYSVLGKVNIMCQLNTAYRLNIIQHNENVSKNRHILGKLIDCIKFCGMFEIALRGHDETQDSANPGIFRGLVNLLAEIDSTLKDHINKSNNRVFMGLSKTIQNELLDSIYEVCRTLILDEINKAHYIAIQADETTDSAILSQLVFIVRYELNGKIQERFLSFLQPENHTADGISKCLLEELTKIKLDETPEKLIAQSYDGASVMSGRNNGVQAKIKEIYKNANYIHCYAHQLNLIIERAASQNKQVKVFFCNLDGFSTFFTRSPKRTAILDEVVKNRLPRSAPTRWNFKSRCVVSVFKYKKDLITCLTRIVDDESSDQSTIRKAVGLKHILNDYDFNYWLYFFNKIMPHCEILYNQLQRREIDSIKMQSCVSSFKSSIQHVRNSTDYDYYNENSDNDDEEEEEHSRQRNKRPRYEDKHKMVAKEVCDIIINNIDDRFLFSDHLSIALLFQPHLFSTYQHSFPETEFRMAVKTFNLDSIAFKHELVVLYNRPDFGTASCALTLLQCFYENNLTTTFVESVKLLKIICTIPMTTAESERCFSTLKRIKTFSRNTMQESRLCALAMCSIEKQLLTSTPNFNELVIDHFTHCKERRMDFIFKQVN
jgi:hypothetical protein